MRRDVAGRRTLDFYARVPGATNYINVSQQFGLAARVPTRGIATADTRADDRLNFAVAR